MLIIQFKTDNKKKTGQNVPRKFVFYTKKLKKQNQKLS